MAHADHRRDHAVTDRRAAILEAAARLIARRGVRGLRMDELATEAGVSTALVYYHFKDRAGILRHTLGFLTDRARRYSTARDGHEPTEPLDSLEESLLLEFQDRADLRENGIAWGELRAGAIFEPELRGPVAEAGGSWIREVTDLLAHARPAAAGTDLASSAERLTALREGLSARHLSGALHPEHARTLMKEAIAIEIAHLDQASPPGVRQHPPPRECLNRRPQ
ncbi:TetR/AcrR family transcriptional regulator [Streptomyces sp. NPDC101191]|uniref:TetR/AcrR family transcriptional regulator n=1 Tax=Streptomyces sp. NPDC101191 TaxID=3366126 RepID=UPI0037FB731C